MPQAMDAETTPRDFDFEISDSELEAIRWPNEGDSTPGKIQYREIPQEQIDRFIVAHRKRTNASVTMQIARLLGLTPD
jgi:hypothetical protein